MLGGGHHRVVTASLAQLRATVRGARGWAMTRHATITVTGWRAPRPGWSGRLGPLPGVRRHEIRLPRQEGPAAVEVWLTEPRPLYLVVGAALAVFAPQPRLPAPLSADVVDYGPPPPWLPPSANLAGWVGREPDESAIRPYDLRLLGAGAADEPAPPAGVLQLAATATGLAAEPTAPGEPRADRDPRGWPRIVVDAGTANPRGYRPPTAGELRAGASEAVLEVSPEGWTIAGPAGSGCAGQGVLDEDDLERLRDLAWVSCARLCGVAPAAEASLVAQLAMTGLVLVGPLPEPVASLLAPELVAIVNEPPPGEVPLEWELRSVAQRREALRRHAYGLVLPAVAGVPGALRTPSVSAVFASDDPAEVSVALAAVRAQTYPNLQIVLGIAGVPPAELVAGVPPAELVAGVPPAELVAGGHPVAVAMAPSSASAAETLAAATARASGSLVTRLDPTARYGPEHIWDLVLAWYYSGATVVGKAPEFVYQSRQRATSRPVMVAAETYAGTVATGAVLLARADLDAMGGWPPTARELVARVRLDGGLTYRTHPLGFVTHRTADGAHGARPQGPSWPGFPPYPEFGDPT